MILITGGRGAVASALAALLREHNLPFRVGSADPSALTLPDGVASVTLDLADPATFPAALDGVTSVFLYAKADGADEFAKAAHQAGVEHLVLLSSASVLVDDPQDNPLAAAHLAAEQALLAGPVPVTILRPTAFAANAGAWAWPIKAGRPVDVPYPGSYTEPVHEVDMAECAFAALTDPAHRGGTFTLTGPTSVTLGEQADIIGRALGRDVAVNEVTDEQWKAQTAQYMPDGYADALLDLWRSAVGHPGTPADGVPHLTGHPARDFAQWVADHRADFEN